MCIHFSCKNRLKTFAYIASKLSTVPTENPSLSSPNHTAIRRRRLATIQTRSVRLRRLACVCVCVCSREIDNHRTHSERVHRTQPAALIDHVRALVLAPAAGGRHTCTNMYCVWMRQPHVQCGSRTRARAVDGGVRALSAACATIKCARVRFNAQLFHSYDSRSAAKRFARSRCCRHQFTRELHISVHPPCRTVRSRTATLVDPALRTVHVRRLLPEGESAVPVRRLAVPHLLRGSQRQRSAAHQQ